MKRQAAQLTSREEEREHMLPRKRGEENRTDIPRMSSQNLQESQAKIEKCRERQTDAEIKRGERD